MLPTSLVRLVLVSFVVVGGADAQMCERSLQSTGSTSLVLGVEESVSAPTLGVRRFGSGVWGGAFVGRTPPELESIQFGTDGFGNYLGLVRYRFLGGGLEMGWSTEIDPVLLCLSGSGTYSRLSGGEIDRFYLNAFGQTVGFQSEQLDLPSASLWRVRGELSADHAISNRAALGVGFFMIHSSGSFFPNDSDDAGISVGLGGLLNERLVLDLRYDYPFWAGDGAAVRDGWLSAHVGWIF